MSGWLVVRRQPSTAVFGGVAAVSNVASPPGNSSSGWLIIRRQPSTAVWGGIAAVSNVARVPSGVLIAGDYDGKTWWKKRWILRL